MDRFIKDNIGVSLAGIQYKKVAPTGKNNIEAEDTFSILEVKEDTAKILIERKMIADVRNPFELSVKTEVEFRALEGVDLTKHFTSEYIKEHINELSGVPMSLISALVTQITGSFGGFPIITPAIFIQNKG